MRAREETDALRRELVANVSHDLRTPLASLRGYLQTLQMKEGLLSSEEQRRYVEIASKNTEKLVRLVDELFELAKLESREIVACLEPFNLAELAQDVLQKFELLAEQKRVRLGCQYRDDLPFVMADIGLIERVLQNLLDNALRHTPEGGAVTIDLSPGSRHIVVRVTDTGSGVPEDAMPHIFDRHFRVGADDGMAGHGAGLGLAIVRRIVELHGSSIEATSAPGAGSTFSFPLPIHST
jgi:signal transduction histidine kinase